MVLVQLRDGASRHLSGLQDSDTRNLALILCLPLLDGVFATLLVTGAVSTFSDIVAVALTLFTGAGALSILYSSSETREEAREMVSNVAPLLVAGAIMVSLLAPVFEQLIYVNRMKYAAALALLVIALEMVEFDLVEKLSVPAIILTGLVLSLKQPSNLAFTFEYVLEGVLTVSVAVLGLHLAALLDPEYLNLSYIQKGGALVLVAISLSMLGVQMPRQLGITLFTVSLLASLQH